MDSRINDGWVCSKNKVVCIFYSDVLNERKKRIIYFKKQLLVF